jgi:hypothetical protein
MRRLLIRSSALLALALSLASAGPGAAAAAQPNNTASDTGTVTATYQGRSIDPQQASHYFCHTRDYPIVRCFDSQAEVDRDLGLVEPTSPGFSSLDGGVTPMWPGGVAYTIAYWDINYGGSALTIYGEVWNLSAIGWNDNISSFKSVNCGIPRYYIDANYSGAYWQNSCNTWSPNLYSLNDQFSSVINEA